MTAKNLTPVTAQTAVNVSTTGQPCPRCGGVGELDMDRSTGNYPTCPDCIGSDVCPKCGGAMQMVFDVDEYPVHLACLNSRCGFIWEF